jgi:O-antigen/teichoic acid export membrane protein
MDVEGVLIGNCIAVAFSWAVLVAVVVRECGYRVEWSKAVPVLRYSFPFLLSTVAGLMSAYADRFLIDTFLSLRLLGIYALALKFSELLDSMIGEPFNRSYGAFRFAMMKEDGAGEKQARIVRYLFMGLMTTALGIVYFARDLLMLMSAPPYWPAASIVPVLMVGSVLKVLAYPIQTGILYEKKTHHIFQIGVVAAVTSVTGNAVLIPLFGLLGAALAQIITASVVLFVTNHISQRYLTVGYEYKRTAIIVGVTVLFFVLSLPLMTMPMYVGIPAKLLLYVIFAATMIFSGALDRSEIGWLRSMLKRSVGR